MHSMMDQEPDDYNSTGFYAARLHVFPKGYFLGSHRDVFNVSKHLGIGDPEMLYLREKLGKDLTGKLLVAFNVRPDNPLEPDWACPGVPAGITKPAQPCEQDPNAEVTLYNSRLGQNQPHHVLREACHYLCQNCHRRSESREKEILEKKDSEGSISVPESERLRVLTERYANNLARTNEIREERIASQGLAAVQVHDRTKNRGYQRRQNKRRRDNPQANADHVEKYKAKEQKRLANGGPPKASSEHRGIVGETLYPPYFMTMLANATQYLIQLWGGPEVYWNHMVTLFDKLLEREKNKEEMKPYIKYTKGGRIKYIPYAYHVAVNPYLEKFTAKLWKVKNYEDAPPHGTKIEKIIEDVVKLFYPS
jgi:hypothetical protein